MSTGSPPTSSKPAAGPATCTCATPGPSTPRPRTHPTSLASCEPRSSSASPRDPRAGDRGATGTVRQGRWGLIARESQTCRAETDVHRPRQPERTAALGPVQRPRVAQRRQAHNDQRRNQHTNDPSPDGLAPPIPTPEPDGGNTP